jgi:site-specific recombinase XerD
LETEPKKRKPQKLPKVLSRDEIEKFKSAFNIKCPTGLRNRVIIETFHRAGLRISELCDLAPEDVNITEHFIYVQLGKNSVDRYIDIGDVTADWLQQWADIRPQSEYFFCTLDGNRLAPVYLRQVCTRKSKQSGVYVNDNHKKRPVWPHLLRACYATELLEEGVNIRIVQELLGHKSVKTTQIYTKIRGGAAAKVIQSRACEQRGIC